MPALLHIGAGMPTWGRRDFTKERYVYVASMGLNMDEQKAVERFKSEVVEPSMSKLVILDFYADWCGPCKALAPMLEKVAAEYADKGVVLKKVDVDAEKFIASKFPLEGLEPSIRESKTVKGLKMLALPQL